tara:strand:+ start:15494 stop:16279 length:786 start_codon:yes stop_codon:yes gene_type:complete
MKYSIQSSQKAQVVNGLVNAPANTYYAHSYDKLFGNYLVSWTDKYNDFFVESPIRVKDFDGNLPSWNSTKYIIPAIKTYIESRENYIIKQPLPFIVFEAIEKLAQILTPYDKVLEFGSGNSTLWFLKQEARLMSIEHSPTWANAVKEFIDHSHFDAELMRFFDFKLSEKQDTMEYIDTLREESFDVIFVDSSNDYNNRNECIIHSLSKLKEGGWIVLDNSDHPNNWPGGVFLDSLYKRERFTGYTPMGLYVSQTSFWQKNT